MLAQHRSELSGSVKFVFQPAEEIGKGALAMIDDGALTNPTPQLTLGLHLWNELPVGQVAITPGAMMASAGFFDLVVNGRGGHGGLPNKTVDPIVALAHIITAMQTVVSRNVPPLETAVISVTKLRAGDAYNIIPERAAAAGTLRTFSQATSELVVERLTRIANHVAEAMDCTVDLNVRWLMPPVVNDAQVVERLQSGFQRIAPEVRLHTDFVTMVSEDVSYFLNRAPGLFMMVGSANASRGLDYGHHHPQFDFDEDALVVGASMLASAVAEYVLPAS
jgi:amidohydrolase